MADITGLDIPNTAYPETVHLPFNAQALQPDLVFQPPGAGQEEDGFWLVIQGGHAVFTENGEGVQLLRDPLPDCLQPASAGIGIGTWRGRPLRITAIDSRIALEAPCVRSDFNAADDRVDIRLLSLAGLAKQVLHWEQQSRCCCRCGAAMARIPGTWGKSCTACGHHQFPHIHPCAIVLVKRGDELLLTRKPGWVAGRYSLVAGFLDFGESLEECAIREVREETGITIRNVRYVGSQNWPFPAQLMAGFVAEYASGELQADHEELEDARWFSRDALPLLPARRSIARWIIDNFK